MSAGDKPPRKHRRGSGRGRRRDVAAEARAVVNKIQAVASERQREWLGETSKREVESLTTDLDVRYAAKRKGEPAVEDGTSPTVSRIEEPIKLVTGSGRWRDRNR